MTGIYSYNSVLSNMLDCGNIKAEGIADREQKENIKESEYRHWCVILSSRWQGSGPM